MTTAHSKAKKLPTGVSVGRERPMSDDNVTGIGTDKARSATRRRWVVTLLRTAEAIPLHVVAGRVYRRLMCRNASRCRDIN